MGQSTTFQVPVYQGERLRALAKRTGKTAGTLLAGFIDQACEAAGIDIQSKAVVITKHDATSTFVIDLFLMYRLELTRDAMASLAETLNAVADRGGVMVDLDHDFEVYRQGSGVVLKIDSVSLRTKQAIYAHPSMSPDVAREVAKGLLFALSPNA